MSKNTSVLNACGFMLAPLPILVMWLDLALPHPFLLALLFFVLLPLVRWLWPTDLEGDIDPSQLPRWLMVTLHSLPSGFAVLWLLSALALPFSIDLSSRSAVQVIEVWFSVWIASSLTLPACHELIHRSDWQSFLGRVLGACSGLFAFSEEHRVHHAKSGRGQDPDCAEQSENVYTFAVRTSIEGFRSGWDFEIARLMRKGERSWTNRILWTGLLSVLFCALWAYADGAGGVLFYLTTALATHFTLRAINYVQHWGLREVPLLTGGHGVSWVSTCIFQSWIILNLALHEQHHLNPSRPYWRLSSQNTDIRLPVSYPLAFLLSLVPPLYRKVMGPRLSHWLANFDRGAPVLMSEDCVNPRVLFAD